MRGRKGWLVKLLSIPVLAACGFVIATAVTGGGVLAGTGTPTAGPTPSGPPTPCRHRRLRTRTRPPRVRPRTSKAAVKASGRTTQRLVGTAPRRRSDPCSRVCRQHCVPHVV